jgi:hypothetical protein
MTLSCDGLVCHCLREILYILQGEALGKHPTTTQCLTQNAEMQVIIDIELFVFILNVKLTVTLCLGS